MSEQAKVLKKELAKKTTGGVRSNTNILSGLYEIKEFSSNRPITAEKFVAKPPRNSKKMPKILEESEPIGTFFSNRRLTLSNVIMLGKDLENKGKPPQTAVGSRKSGHSPVVYRPVTYNPNGLLGKSQKSNPRTHSLIRKTEEEVLNSGLPDYTVKQVLGKGAYATVRLAIHNETNRKFAIKTYDKYQILDPQKKNNMMREIEILKKIDHPHIVKLFETVDSSKHFHLIMEYVPGVSLYTHLKSKPNNCLEENEAKRIFKQILSAIEYCHSRNIAHRDIKLDNILLDVKNNVKIIDFGFSTLNSDDEKTRIFCGTPSYMAPEIVGRKDYYSIQADIWALGILLYVMIVGKMPFKAYNDKELYRRIEKRMFTLPAGGNESLKELINLMLELNPRKRPSVKALIENEWVSSSGILRSTTQNFVTRPCTESMSLDLNIISGIVSI